MSAATKPLEERIDALSENLSKSIDDWKNANEEKRTELEKTIESMQNEIGALKDSITSRPSLPGVDVGKSGEKDKWSWGRFLKMCCMPKLAKDAEYGYEVEVLKQTEDMIQNLDDRTKTAINAATGAGGGFLIPTEVQDDIIPELEASSIAQQLGVTTLPNLNGNLKWTKDEGGITASYINTEEEESGDESTPTFSAFTLEPHPVGVFIPMTWEMQTQSAVSLEAWARGRIASKIALREDLSIFNGSGSNGEPLGVVGTPGVDSSASLAGLIHGRSTAAETASQALRNFMKVVANQNGLAEAMSPGWAMSVNFQFELAGVYDENGREKFQNALNPVRGAVGPELMGYNMRASTQLNGGSDDEIVIFGPWRSCYLGRWGSLMFAASDETETNFRKMRRTIRGIWAHDVGNGHPEAFSVEDAGDSIFAAS